MESLHPDRRSHHPEKLCGRSNLSPNHGALMHTYALSNLLKRHKPREWSKALERLLQRIADYWLVLQTASKWTGYLHFIALLSIDLLFDFQ